MRNSKDVVRLYRELRPYAHNVKQHPEDQIARLVQSMLEYGYTQKILIDEDNSILAGHARYMALGRIITSGDIEVPCSLVEGLSEVQKRAYRIIDNKIPTDAPWSLEYVEQEVAYLLGQEYENADLYGLKYFAPTDYCPPEIVKEEDDPQPVDSNLEPGDSIVLPSIEIQVAESTELPYTRSIQDSQKLLNAWNRFRKRWKIPEEAETVEAQSAHATQN